MIDGRPFSITPHGSSACPFSVTKGMMRPFVGLPPFQSHTAIFLSLNQGNLSRRVAYKSPTNVPLNAFVKGLIAAEWYGISSSSGCSFASIASK